MPLAFGVRQVYNAATQARIRPDIVSGWEDRVSVEPSQVRACWTHQRSGNTFEPYVGTSNQPGATFLSDRPRREPGKLVRILVCSTYYVEGIPAG